MDELYTTNEQASWLNRCTKLAFIS